MFVESIPSQACTQVRASLLSIPEFPASMRLNLHTSTYLKSASLRKSLSSELELGKEAEKAAQIFFSSSLYKPIAFRDLLERDCVMSCIVRVPTNRQCTCCSLQQHNILLHFFSFCLFTPSSLLGLLSLKYFLYCCTCKM